MRKISGTMLETEKEGDIQLAYPSRKNMLLVSVCACVDGCSGSILACKGYARRSDGGVDAKGAGRG